jgi:hypothetical protein
MIRISSLPLIETNRQFHAAEQILLVDVLYIGDAPRSMREFIKENHGGFVYEKKTYMPITLTGQPESLIANAEKGIHFKFDKGFENLYTLNGNLDYTIRRKKLYDLSAYIGYAQIAFEREVDFIIERYLAGYQEPEPVEDHKTHLLTTPALPAIGMKRMAGLKPVRK